jgi:hypothetical protein
MSPNITAFLFKNTKHTAILSSENIIRQIQSSINSKAHGIDLLDPPCRSAQMVDLLFDSTWYSRQFANRKPLDSIPEESDDDLRGFNIARPARRAIKPKCECCRQSNSTRITKSKPCRTKWRARRSESTEPQAPDHIEIPVSEDIRRIQTIVGVDFNGKKIPAQIKACIWPSTEEGQAWQRRRDLMSEIRKVHGYFTGSPEFIFRNGYPATVSRMEIQNYVSVEPDHPSESSWTLVEPDQSWQDEMLDWEEKMGLPNRAFRLVPVEEIGILDEKLKDWEESDFLEGLDERLGAGESYGSIVDEWFEAEGF